MTLMICAIDYVPPRKHERRSSNVVLMLGRRRRRWANIKTALDERLVFAEQIHRHRGRRQRRRRLRRRCDFSAPLSSDNSRQNNLNVFKQHLVMKRHLLTKEMKNCSLIG